MLLAVLQLLVALARCQDYSEALLSQDTSFSGYAGETESMILLTPVQKVIGSMCVYYLEEDWGDGLRVLSTFRPDLCEHKAKTGDVIHYHYVGRLHGDGTIFGRR